MMMMLVQIDCIITRGHQSGFSSGKNSNTVAGTWRLLYSLLHRVRHLRQTITYERMALIHVAVAQWAPVERKRCFWDRNDNICTHAVIVVAWVRKERVLLLFIILDILWTATHNCVCVVSFSLIEKLWWPRDTKAQNGDQMSGRFHQQPSERACRPNARRSTQFGSWCFTDGRRRCWASSSHFQHFFCAHNFKTLPQVLFDLKLMIH